MEGKVWIDGTFFSEAEAKISVLDHGLLYGDGVFEGIRAYEGRDGRYVFKLKEHLDRLWQSAKGIDLKIPISREEMEKAVLAVFSQSPEIRYLRLVVTRGIGSLGLSPTSCSRPSIIIIPGAWKTYYSSEKYQKGLTAIIAKTRTKSPKGLSPNIKSLNYLQNILARLEAIKARVDEAIMLTEDGYLAEACVDNLFIVTDDQTILTPPKEIVLEGITRATVMELAQKIGFKVKEKLLRPLDLEMAEEIFLTGTAAEIIGVVEVDGRKVGSGRVGEVTKKLMAEFKKVVGIPETGTKIPQKEVRLI